ncbi:HlyD family efflux transporter periplasmic adaptor subunit [Deminuibacter soli]|uniref:HlyD family efflux transporter periplasmic adaptor subunit n=1 Tax=Deminuibacter soli TaxID=2291815 RepID=A0A3E1NFF7_9BACT|nr:HlyD family efflux transporter periplasmic adaptor subunit [Deminuibacter soli]RFM26699.1 HlyD family efflux transporter periplasmic adaptor subunit [Deminuibacter soli]
MPEHINLSEVHSEEVQDIIGRIPSWVTRNGTIVIACLVIAMLVGAWFIKYPDVATARVLISSATPPVKLVAQAGGRITQLAVTDGQQVAVNDLIAVIDNTANTGDMLYIKKIATLLDTAIDIRKAVASVQLPGNMQLGEMQADYVSLFQAVNNCSFFYSNAYYAAKLNAVRNQQNQNERIREGIEQRSRLQHEQLMIEQWKDSINRILVSERVIAPSEYNEIRKNYLSQKIGVTDNSNAVSQNMLQHDEYGKTISDLQQQLRTEEKDVLFAVRNAAKKIRGQIAAWERLYVLRSPVEGRLVFFRVWKSNQYVGNGETVFMVVPGMQQYVVRAMLPTYRAGKIQQGQKVLIKLQEYPSEEFGLLEARVDKLANVSMDSAYTLQLRLTHGFQTTRNRLVEARPEITGTAEIITNDKSVLQRIFESIYGKLHDH